MPKRNISPALFDVKPKGRPLAELTREVNLRPKREAQATSVPPLPSTPQRSALEQITSQAPVANEKDIIAHEVESALDEQETLVADLVRAGATIHEPVRQDKHARPRVIAQPKAVIDEPQPEPEPELPPNPIAPNQSHCELEEFWSNTTPATLSRASFEPHYKDPFPVHSTPPPATHLSPAARDVEVWVQRLKEKPSKQKKGKRRWPFFSFIGGLIVLGGFTVAAFHSNAFVAKQNVLQNGANALANLEEAKHSLEAFNFSEAVDRFALANDDFDKASGTLSTFGASFLSLFGDLPGLSKVRSANNLVQAGQYISKSGEGLSAAFSSLYKTNVLASLTSETSTTGSFSEPIDAFRDTLLDAEKNIDKAKNLLEEVDLGAIPADKQVVFESFKSKIPDFQAYIGKAVQYADFLSTIIGENGQKTYMILLQNTSEKRPTGGFPGTYAIISFDHGTLKKVFVDDIYNPDGQIKANIIPPRPLQHITPNLGLRDVNWFADFPTSAQKIEEYYKLDGGAQLDGVFAIDPTLIANLLEITGPIPLPAYNVVLDKNNFLAEIQDEVEYRADRAQPKKILVDFQPAFFEKLSAQDKSQWLVVMHILLDAMEQKHVLAYFNNPALQKEVVQDGFAGQVKDAPGDYVQVAFSNVKGTKGDAVTANAMQLTTEFEPDSVQHTMTIIRAHNGGQSQYAFYNKELPAYVKVYLPLGAVFDHIEGISHPDYKPLIDYESLGFKADPDIASIEQNTKHPVDGVDVFEESGKTVVGFWMITKPKKTSTVILSYHVPNAEMNFNGSKYDFLWQKQSGSTNDQIHVSAKLPLDASLISHSPDVQIIGNTVVLDTDLTVDRGFEVVYH